MAAYPVRPQPSSETLTPKFGRVILSSIGMARVRSPEKRSAILQAAVREIAENGLAAPTAQIAKRAGVAAGTLFTYFASKEALLNQLYLELKGEVYTRINTDFPHKGSLEVGHGTSGQVFSTGRLSSLRSERPPCS